MTQYGPKSYNIDVNQLGASQFPRFSILQRSPYKDALVEDVILNEEHPEYSKEFGTNIGMIKVRFIPQDRGVPKEQLNWAMPLESSIREYPLKNEMVLIFYSIGRLFYTRRININNKITENSWPGLSEKFSPQSRNVRTEDIQLAAQGGPSYRPWDSQQSIELGDEFAENPSVKMVRPNEGDTIIQGRFGNIIRFGSSVFSNPTTPRPQPNLLLTVGQDSNKVLSTINNSPYALVYENINKDKSCIWMVTDEKVVLEPATLGTPAHLLTAESSDENNYTGAQIFINSDRVILNSKVNEISLFAKKEINLSAVESITIDSGKITQITGQQGIKLSTPTDILLSAKTVSFNATNDFSIETPKNLTISAQKIFIGSGGSEEEPMVLGVQLAKLLYNLVSTLSTATVITSTGPAFLSPGVITKLQKILVDDLKNGIAPKLATFNSTNNFTSKTN